MDLGASLVEFDRPALDKLGPTIVDFALAEGFETGVSEASLRSRALLAARSLRTDRQ